MSKEYAHTYRYDYVVDRFYLKPIVHWGDEAMEVWALWDTGANITHISKRVVAKLQPEFVKNAESVSAYSKRAMPKYKVNITLQEFATFPDIVVGVLEQDQPIVDVVIGMDLITQFDSAISSDNNGNTVISLRYPSRRQMIDFENE